MPNRNMINGNKTVSPDFYNILLKPKYGKPTLSRFHIMFFTKTFG